MYIGFHPANNLILIYVNNSEKIEIQRCYNHF